MPISLSTIKRLQKTYGLSASKSLGQNFLIDSNIAQKIVESVQSNERVVEIGPGVGSLTVFLAKNSQHVFAIEFDQYLLDPLREIIREEGVEDRVSLIHHDVMKVDLEKLCTQESINVIVGNLPYNISAPLIANIARYVPSVEKLIVMVQKEVGERLCAQQGTRLVSAITLKCQFFMEVQTLFTVSPQSFFPRPRVDSIVLSLARHTRTTQVDVEELFHIIDMAFAQRRKMLRQSLRGACDNIGEVLECSGVDQTWRAERCTLDDFIKITHTIQEMQ